MNNKKQINNNIKKFNSLNVSSKFALCGLPIRVDTYKTCSFGCRYCFANNRKIMEFDKSLQIGDMDQLERKVKKVLVDKKGSSTNFLDVLLEEGITWHCGGMSDPFQPCEKEYKVTKRLIEISNHYKIKILFSTKSNTVYGADIRPELHTFQLSVTNIDDNIWRRLCERTT